MMLDQALIKSLISYDPSTGICFWLPRSPDLFTATERWTEKALSNQWNGRFAGRVVGCIGSDGLLQAKVFGVNYRLHQLIWLYQTGTWCDVRINHTNDCLTDNRWSNLREATHSQSATYKKTFSRTGNGLRGAYPTHRRGNAKPWRASIVLNGKRTHLGVYDTELEAHEAYLAAAEFYFHEFARAS